MLKFHVMLKCSTGWRRLIGSPKLHIIFHKRATRYRALLRKKTYKDKGPYESSPPCISQLASMKCQDAHSSLLHNFSKVGPLLCFPYTRLHIRFSRIFVTLYGLHVSGMSHGTWAFDTAHMDTSWYIGMSHGTHIFVIVRVDKTWHI